HKCKILTDFISQCKILRFLLILHGVFTPKLGEITLRNTSYCLDFNWLIFLFSASIYFITEGFVNGVGFTGDKTVINLCIAFHKNAIHRNYLFISNENAISFFYIFALNVFFHSIFYDRDSNGEITFIATLKR